MDLTLTPTPHPNRYNRPGFLSATANRIEESICQVPSDKRSSAHVLYTAQGLPAKYVEELGDPYQEQVERSVALVNAELQSRGFGQTSSLAYQGAFGPQQVPMSSTYMHACMHTCIHAYMHTKAPLGRNRSFR